MWNDPLTTPPIIQTAFGSYGQNLPGDGEAYCAPTSVLMGLYWLSSNGFTQLAPATYNGQTDPTALNLEKVLGGLLDTSIRTGTTSGGIESGVGDYFAACGIGSDQYTVTPISWNPDVTWLANQLAPNIGDGSVIALVVFSVGWFYRPNLSVNTLRNTGGHVLAPLKIADLSAGTVTLNNSAPTTFETDPDNPQTVTITQMPSGWKLLPNSKEDPYLPSQDYTQVNTPILGPGSNGQGRDYALLWGGQAWIISASALPSTSGYQPTTWTLSRPKVINTSAGSLYVQAPLADAGGLHKRGFGILWLGNTNALTGQNIVQCGTLASSQTSGAPFGTGEIVLQGNSNLVLAPVGSSPAAVSIASGTGATLSLGGGGGQLQLTGQNQFTVTLGGMTDGNTPNINRQNSGTFFLNLGGGLSQLGSDQKILIAGSGNNLPVLTNGIVSPYIIGLDSNSTDGQSGSGGFLTYSLPTGFQAAQTTQSTSVGINSLQSDVIYEVLDNQTINDGNSVQVGALEMNGGNVEGSDTTLLVGTQQSGGTAGIIMNRGIISAGSLKFGAAEGVIYAGVPGGGITSSIYGSSGLTVFGPGIIILSADNANLSGTVVVNSGMLLAVNEAGVQGASATGSGNVIVYPGAILEINGSIAGPINVGQSATLNLNGGTVTGTVLIQATSGSSSLPGGILKGSGVVAGPATVNGVIQSGQAAGILEFKNNVTIEGGSFYWTLQSLVDDNSSQAGTGWNALQFDFNKATVGTEAAPLNLFLDFSLLNGDPDGGDPFWNSGHTWTIFTFANGKLLVYPEYGNFYYGHGQFDLTWENGGTIGKLVWEPSTTFQSPADRRVSRYEDQERIRGKVGIKN